MISPAQADRILAQAHRDSEMRYQGMPFVFWSPYRLQELKGFTPHLKFTIIRAASEEVCNSWVLLAVAFAWLAYALYSFFAHSNFIPPLIQITLGTVMCAVYALAVRRRIKQLARKFQQDGSYSTD